jgi:hypothetical protein
VDDDFAVGVAHVFVCKAVLLAQHLVIINLAVANQATNLEVEWLVGGLQVPIYGQTMKSKHAALVIYKNAVIWSAVRQFDKLRLQFTQKGQVKLAVVFSAIGALEIKYAAHCDWFCGTVLFCVVLCYFVWYCGTVVLWYCGTVLLLLVAYVIFNT